MHYFLRPPMREAARLGVRERVYNPQKVLEIFRCKIVQSGTFWTQKMSFCFNVYKNCKDLSN